MTTTSVIPGYSEEIRSGSWVVRSHIPVVSEFTGQSNGLPIALPGPGKLEGRGERPRAASPDPGRAVGNPIDCPVNSETSGTVIIFTVVLLESERCMRVSHPSAL